MFAHQVIEDLKKEHTIRKDAISTVISLIKCAHQVYIGDYWEMALLSGMKVGTPLLNKQRLQHMRMPYKCLWIDSLSSGSSKKGALVIDQDETAGFRNVNSEDQYQVCAFHYFKDINRWRLNPCMASFNDKRTTFNHYSLPFTHRSLPEDVLQKAQDMLCDPLIMVITTIMLLNCKNISTEKIFAAPKLNKKRRKNWKQELFDYHVLNVVVPSARREYRESTKPLSHNRVHLCRGHFKEYTSEHPLFGRLTGLYWWQPHVRGQNREGIVMKEYSLNKNKEFIAQ